MRTPEEIKKLCGWDISENLEPGSPRNKDFFEADVQKVMDLLRAERTQPAPEVGEYLNQIISDCQAICNYTADRATEEMAKNIADQADKALSLPGLVAVECQSCKGIKAIEQGILKARCPQNCDKGKVWVRR